MGDGSVWEIDRLAAAELLALLRVAPEADWANLAAKAFSKSRLQSYEWAARRVHESAIKALEAESIETFERKDPIWTDGFRHAEECLMAQSPSELLEVVVRPPRSKGQVLRSLFRAAKRGATISAA
jgi:hypothetical protein